MVATAVQVSITANDPAAGEPTNGQFTASLSGPSTTNTVIAYTLSGTAANGTDYAALSGSVTILAGATSALINVTSTDDALLESTETLTAQIANSSFGAVSIAGASATATIADNDTATATLSATNGAEGGANVVYTVTLSQVNNTGSAITFDLADLLTGSASAAADYTAIPAGTQITVANGAATGSYTVAVTDDALLESTETLTAQIANSSFGAVSIAGASATATIADNDTATATLSATNGAEGGANVVTP